MAPDFSGAFFMSSAMLLVALLNQQQGADKSGNQSTKNAIKQTGIRKSSAENQTVNLC